MRAFSQNFLFRHREFGLFWGGMALVNIAAQIEAVTIRLWLGGMLCAIFTAAADATAAARYLAGVVIILLMRSNTTPTRRPGSQWVQIATPDHMRGRVSSVSARFILGSNELGEFESGVASRFLGPIGAAVFGGIGTMIVTGTWAWMFPALRNADRLGGAEPDTEVLHPHSMTAQVSG